MVKFNKDDGLEFFGGTVEVKHVICFAIADDSFDWTDGWQGKGQFMIALQMGDDADNGFESDNNGDNNNLTPRSNPTLYNVTLIGDPYDFPGNESDIGLLLREGTAATIRNFIIIGFKEGAIDIDHAATFDQVTSGELTLESGIVYGNCVVDGCDGEFKPDSDDASAPITTRDFVTDASNVHFIDRASESRRTSARSVRTSWRIQPGTSLRATCRRPPAARSHPRRRRTTGSSRSPASSGRSGRPARDTRTGSRDGPTSPTTSSHRHVGGGWLQRQ